MLNEKQLKVVSANDHFIFLLAGAGTGKTTVIINKINKILKEGIKPENILVLSFTRKSVKDLKTKLNDNEKLFITTFHGFCYSILNELMDIKIVEEKSLIINGFSKDEITKIDYYKRSNKENKIVKRYNKFLKKNNLIDYTDLEHILVKKLTKDKLFKTIIQNKYKYIFVDEFQDTSEIQYILLKQLLNKDSFCICVGDPNQSIYSFRGASIKVINSFIKDFNANVYLLDINYRSGALILSSSNRLIKHNKSSYNFNLIPHKKDKGKIVIKEFNNINDKNEYIVNEIRKLLNENIKQEDIVVIYRNHYFSNEIKKELNKTYFDKINYLTIHQVKGLEFKCVFFIGLEEDKLPQKDANIEEERRLFYVGITRAKNMLYLLSLNEKKKSRFLKELK